MSPYRIGNTVTEIVMLTLFKEIIAVYVPSMYPLIWNAELPAFNAKRSLLGFRVLNISSVKATRRAPNQREIGFYVRRAVSL
jgi:hypothetical protein